MSAPLQKYVNGQLVNLTPAEETAVRAQWANPPAPPVPVALDKRVAAIEAMARAKGWAL